MATKSLTRIEEEIAKHRVELSNLYAEKNTFSSVFRLPNEILAYIFIFCARNHYYCRLGWYLDNRFTWLRVSYVCRHWRNVALNCPTFWSYISDMPPRWIEEQLIRSKRAPLKVLGPGYFRPTLEKVLLSHIERMQELTISLPNDLDAVRKILPILFLRAPLLQYLSIDCDYLHMAYNMSSIPLVDHDTPALRLRTLKLTRCPLSWHLLKLNRLTGLHLVHTRPQQNMEDVLTALGCMQELSHLILLDALPPSPRQSSHAMPNTLQEISLPHLSRLRIDDSLSAIIAFLTCLNLPFLTAVRLECNFEKDSPLVDYTLFSSVLAQRFHTITSTAPSTPAIRSVVIQCDLAWARLTFSASERHVRDHPLECDVNWDSDIPLCIRFSQLPYVDLKERIIGDMCSSIPFTYARSLHVIKPPTSLDFWDRILGHLQDLQYLKLSHGDMPPLAFLLSKNLAGNGSSNRVFVPVLEELELYDITFAAVPAIETETLGVDLPSLEDALFTREDPEVDLKMQCCLVYNDGEESDEEDPDAIYY